MNTAHWFAACAAQIQASTPCPIPPDLPTLFPLPLDPAQTRAVARLVRILSHYGGALLADVTGLGKTRTACATALCWLHASARPATVLCCVPARQLQRWKNLWNHIPTRHSLLFCTHTALSRGWAPEHPVDLILVDEAHHFRHAATKRTTQLAKLVSTGAALLLITATPICNGPRDLHTLLRLFLGEHDTLPTLGFPLSEAFTSPHGLLELAMALIVRRERLDASGSPLTKRPNLKLHTLSYAPSPEEAYIWQNLGPQLAKLTLSAITTCWPEHLFSQFMLRRWESGPHALKTSLQALILWHEKTLAHLQNPHLVPPPQGFTASAPDLLRQESLFLHSEATPPTQAHLPAVRHDLQILKALLEKLELLQEQGCGRTRAILDLLLTHPGQKVLLFTSHVDAALSLFDQITQTLGPRVQVGCVTGKNAKVTGIGSIAHEELMRRFSPLSQGVITPLPPQQHVQILVATDCIAEGVNLQDCGHVILVDLPYSPLQVEQRIGRLIRPGNPHATVTVTLPRPKAWPDSLGMRHTITKKVHAASRCATPYLHAPLITSASTPPAASILLDQLDLRDQLLLHWATLPTPLAHTSHPTWFHVPSPTTALWVFYTIASLWHLAP